MKCLRIYSTADGEPHLVKSKFRQAPCRFTPGHGVRSVGKLCGDTPSVSRAFRRARDIQPTLLARADEAIE